tara:strand:+ start:2803 stop:3024 length:222 start_codon:yes stop_codon:yes gene_type:complete
VRINEVLLEFEKIKTIIKEYITKTKEYKEILNDKDLITLKELTYKLENLKVALNTLPEIKESLPTEQTSLDQY